MLKLNKVKFVGAILLALMSQNQVKAGEGLPNNLGNDAVAVNSGACDVLEKMLLDQALQSLKADGTLESIRKSFISLFTPEEFAKLYKTRNEQEFINVAKRAIFRQKDVKRVPDTTGFHSKIYRFKWGKERADADFYHIGVNIDLLKNDHAFLLMLYPRPFDDYEGARYNLIVKHGGEGTWLSTLERVLNKNIDQINSSSHEAKLPRVHIIQGHVDGDLTKSVDQGFLLLGYHVDGSKHSYYQTTLEEVIEDTVLPRSCRKTATPQNVVDQHGNKPTPGGTDHPGCCRADGNPVKGTQSIIME